jgi:hypothetical protein
MRKDHLALLSFGLVWACFGLSCTGGPSGGTTNRSTSPAPTDQGPALELVALHREREYDYLTAQGRVKNLTVGQLSDVMVEVEYYDSNGNLVTSKEGVLDYRPLRPGQISPFTVMLHDDPAIKTCRVKFKHLSDEIIPHKDSVLKETSTKRRNKK